MNCNILNVSKSRETTTIPSRSMLFFFFPVLIQNVSSNYLRSIPSPMLWILFPAALFGNIHWVFSPFLSYIVKLDLFQFLNAHQPHPFQNITSLVPYPQHLQLLPNSPFSYIAKLLQWVTYSTHSTASPSSPSLIHSSLLILVSLT